MIKRGGTKMTQKKKTDSTYVTDSFVEGFWDQYEESLSRIRKLGDERQDTYLNALKQSNKFNGDYRNTIRDLYKETRNANIEIAKALTSNISGNMPNEVSKSTEKLRNLWQETATKMEEISLTPLKQTLNLMDEAQNRIEQNVEEYIKYSQERQKTSSNASNQFVKQVREQNQNFTRRLEDTFKTFVKTGS
jgi:hypothetical protein